MFRTSWATVGTGKNRDSDKGSNKGNVQENPEPAKPSGTATLEKHGENHANECVQDSSSENAFDRAECGANPTSRLDDIDDVVDFAETSREESEGDNRREELSNASQAEKPTVEARVLKLIWNPARQKTRFALRPISGAVVVVCSSVIVVRHIE
jgi:hypothetical protein